jgi:hypothetical protein
MLHTNFDSSIVTDFAPYGSLCEWCGKPAVQQLTALGGPRHNKSGFFCSLCGEEFARAVAEPLRAGAVSEASTIKHVSS